MYNRATGNVASNRVEDLSWPTASPDHLWEKQLENLNRLTGMPLQPYTHTEAGIVPGNGNYHLDSAYNGYAFVRMTLEPSGTGTSQVGNMGYVSLKAVSNQIRMFSEGYRAAKESTFSA